MTDWRGVRAEAAAARLSLGVDQVRFFATSSSVAATSAVLQPLEAASVVLARCLLYELPAWRVDRCVRAMRPWLTAFSRWLRRPDSDDQWLVTLTWLHRLGDPDLLVTMLPEPRELRLDTLQSRPLEPARRCFKATTYNAGVLVDQLNPWRS